MYSFNKRIIIKADDTIVASLPPCTPDSAEHGRLECQGGNDLDTEVI